MSADPGPVNSPLSACQDAQTVCQLAQLGVHLVDQAAIHSQGAVVVEHQVGKLEYPETGNINLDHCFPSADESRPGIAQ
ncbi:hypothetical protein [Candidatus Contendibacter odensensis]|uniref:hypothetical protein n=1 Tax=Candidatus Contendibacter odensensis TaxID=1400860 RepID=UPI0012B68333|nr:hypothetical protein [Candidatus Contendobacter odensis]